MPRISARVRKLEKVAEKRAAQEDAELHHGWPRAAGKPRGVLIAECIARAGQRGLDESDGAIPAMRAALAAELEHRPELRKHAAVRDVVQASDNPLLPSRGKTAGA
jgi:hypothetical protein